MQAAYELRPPPIQSEYEEIGSSLWYRVHCSVKVRPPCVNPGDPLLDAPEVGMTPQAVANDIERAGPSARTRHGELFQTVVPAGLPSTEN
ncbi:hypothetical protein GCM10017673_43030 [Streptosporangium violaceochromogenes]|nr:hypothetical protein GCM10017673_43030 [Streptosporangium violaceochromogenes]